MPRFQGLNINAQLLTSSEKTFTLNIIGSMGAMSHTTMDDWGFSQSAASMFPQTMFAHRAWNPWHVWDDTKEYHEIAPEKEAQRVHGFPKLPNIWHHILNEPGSDNPAKLVDWLIEFMELTGRNGKYPTKCLIGNFAVDKTWTHQGDHIAGQEHWLRFFRAFQKHIGWHKLGIHRYWIGDVRLAYTGDYPANIRLDHPRHKDYLDPGKHRLRLERLPNGDLPPHWTGYADLWVKLLCIENGIQIPEEMESEGIHDEKRDAGTAPYNEYVDRNYRTEYGNGRGTWTWAKWSEASSGKPYLHQLRDQLIARTKVHMQLERDYPQLRGKQHGAHWFSFTKAKDWTSGGFSLYTPVVPVSGQDFEHASLLAIMGEIPEYTVESETPMPEPTPDQYIMERKLLSSRAVTNIRDNHNTTGTIIDTLRADDQDVIEVLASDKALWTGNNLNWYRLEYGGGVRYVADTNNLVWSDVPDDTPDTGEPGETPDNSAALAALRADLDSLQADYDALAANFATLQANVDNLQAPYEAMINQAVEAKIAYLTESILVDVVVGDFTIRYPRILQDTLVDMTRGTGALQNAIADAIENGVLSAKKVADIGFSAQSVTTTISDLPDDTLDSDIMLHSGDENDNAA